ncbi:MAG: cysteine--tRNA ligase [Micrococcales bacterium]|nr:MAG: cysteine--tRNA ligase [Micrococcales bacterium]PIE27137.1 MAG: cysteine--tRNA ligase [Micrococcales bacterium]
MTLRLHDSATASLRDFEPVVPGQVGIYICGLTTDDDPHIGHVRFAVAFDILRNWLEFGHGYEVRFIRNVTDIDDKILTKARQEGQLWFERAYRFERATTWALETLGVRPPTYEPRATGHIPDMVELMSTLVQRGHAYPAPDGSGAVYFDVRSWPAYGELTRQHIEDMAPAEDADPRGKRDPRDFALWKGAKADEPPSAGWDTPFGRGRPGWHLECSAMARRYLGAEFDIHGGGVDLRFPHHENEQAQSRAAGMSFARYWLHNAWVTVKDQKMGKSLGNSLTVANLVQRVEPIVLRYYLGAAHYRSTIEYTENSLTEAQSAVHRISAFLRRAAGHAPVPVAGQVPEAFRAAMDDDINVPAGLSVVFDAVRAGNTALDAADHAAAGEHAAAVRAMTAVLGVDPMSATWATRPTQRMAAADHALDTLVRSSLRQRAQARAAKDFATADSIRDTLAEAGIEITDTAEGPRWSVAEKAGN